MPKPFVRANSQYTIDALQLLGQLIREGRLSKSLTTGELALRAGVSRSLVQRIERGDAGCSIGAVFEVAAICGVSLFELDARGLAEQVSSQKARLSLLPKAVRAIKKPIVHDDF